MSPLRTSVIFAVLLTSALSLAPAIASPVAPKGNYALDPDHTQVVFAIKHMGISTFYGRLGKVSGIVNFDQEHPQASTLNVAVDTTSIDTHVPALDSSLPNSVFQADKFQCFPLSIHKSLLVNFDLVQLT